MSKKQKKPKPLTEAEILAIEAQIVARKKEILNGVLRALAAPSALDNLSQVAEALDAGQKQEETLNRVHATIGHIMMQKARENKAKQLKSAKKPKVGGDAK